MIRFILRSTSALSLIFFTGFFQARAEETPQAPQEANANPSRSQANEHTEQFGFIFFSENMFDQKFEDEKRIFDNTEGERSQNYMLAITTVPRESRPSLLLGLSNQHYKSKDKVFNINQRSFFFGGRYKLYEISKDLHLVPGGAIHLMNFDIENLPTDTKEFFDPAAAEVNLGLLWNATKALSIYLEYFRIQGFGFSSNGARIGLGL